MKALVITMLATMIPSLTFAECRIVDYGDRMEAVCNGSPLTAKEEAELKKQKELESQSEREYKAKQEAEEIREKLAKVECTGISGECGPGRVCFTLVTAFGTKQTCKTKEEADRTMDKINDLRRDFNRSNSDRLINQKLDNIDRKLRYGY